MTSHLSVSILFTSRTRRLNIRLPLDLLTRREPCGMVYVIDGFKRREVIVFGRSHMGVHTR